MVPQPTPPLPPRTLLSRWLAQLHYNSIRNIESVIGNVTRTDGSLTRGTALRGFRIADDLVLTRKRTFYRVIGLKATPMSIEEVAANYSLALLQARYRVAVEQWKNSQRHRKRA
jgi:hypothetical protein